MTAQMHRDHRIPVLIGHVEQHPVPGDAGIVDHDVETTQTIGAGNQFVGGRPLADIADHRDGLGAGRADLIEDVGCIQGLGHVVDDEGGPGTRQPDGLGAAQAGCGAGHHRDASGKIGQLLVCGQLYEYL